MLDVPLAILFIATLFMINPVLGLIALIFAVSVFPLRMVGRFMQKRHLENLQQANLASNMAYADAVRSPDTVRVFDPHGWLMSAWSDATSKTSHARSQMVQSHGALEFRDISFTHPDMPAPLFESLDLVVPAGAILLVKGANGTGKTTLNRLLLGLVTPARGQILADGIDIRQLTAKWWNQQIGYMPQEPSFFDASIRTNLQNSNPHVSDEQLLAVLEDAGLKRYIREDIFGLNSRLSAGGAHQAVGIRKRLALARAMVRNAPIMIFDEPTEGLDAQGRQRVYAALDWLMEQGHTIIVSSDDIEITERAQIILDLDRKPVPSVCQVPKPTAVTVVQQ